MPSENSLAELLSLAESEATTHPALRNEVLRVALSLRKRRLDGQGATYFFTPISADGGNVFEIGNALAQIGQTSVLAIDARQGKVEAIGHSAELSSLALSGLTDLKQIASQCAQQELSPKTILVLGSSGLRLRRTAPRFTTSVPLFNQLSLLLEGAKKSFGYVLIDGPSILTDPGGMLSAAACDGVVFTFKAGSTKLRDAQQAKERVEMAGGKVVGFIMETPRR